MQIVVDATHCSHLALEPLPGGASAAERVVSYVDRLSAERGAALGPDTVTALVTDAEMQFPESWSVDRRSDWSVGAILEAVSAAADEALLFVAADTPFLDAALSLKMLDDHARYFADVSFADGYPEGLTPLILSPRVLPTLATLQEKHSLPYARSVLLDLVMKDINAFDVETELSPVDLRYLRLILAADTKENAELCRRFAELDPRTVDDVVRIASENAELLRVLPAYLSVQVLEQEVQEVSYSPYREMRGKPTEPGAVMDVDAFQDLVRKFAEMNPAGTVGISHWGEVALHPDPVGLIDAVGRHGLDLVVETSGVGWREEDLQSLSREVRSHLTWIVGLDAMDPAVYATLRGAGFEEAMRFVAWSLDAYPEHTYLQAVRLAETEDHLEAFYKAARKRTENVIIQKYDYFCGRLPQRKVTDISPVVRRPCWHVKRDLIVLVDGSVPLCREDIDRNHVLGNALEEPLEKVWQRGEEIYRRHVSEDYPALCEQCDEYYTFNF